MATFSDVFTQGGQTQIHKLRMIKQVIGSTLKAGLWVFLITFVLLVWKDHGWQDFWFLLCYFKAYLRVEYFSVFPSGFWDDSWIVYLNGEIQTVSDSYLMFGENFKNTVSFICLSLLRKLAYSLMISIVGLGAVSWFWVKMGKKKQATKILSGFERVSPKVLRKKRIWQIHGHI